MKVEIKGEIINIFKERIKDSSEFKDVEEYINYILKQVTEKLAQKQTNTTSKDEHIVKKRLKALGYID